jgi:hypothetical protein
MKYHFFTLPKNNCCDALTIAQIKSTKKATAQVHLGQGIPHARVMKKFDKWPQE